MSTRKSCKRFYYLCRLGCRRAQRAYILRGLGVTYQDSGHKRGLAQAPLTTLFVRL